MTREDAYALLTEYTKKENLIKHALAVEAAMRAYARKFGEDEEAWGIVGLLHDFDYDMYPSLEDHPFKGAEILREKGYPEEWILFAVDELCGFITAVALVRPDKKLESVKVKSVKKKFCLCAGSHEIRGRQTGVVIPPGGIGRSVNGHHKHVTNSNPIRMNTDQEKRQQDQALIERARNGDQKAFEELLNKYKNLVFNEEYAFSTWLMKIATNNCIDFLRKKKLKTISIDQPVQHKDDEFQIELPSGAPSPERVMLSHEQRHFIQQAIDELPPLYRHVIVLRHQEEKSYEEIAEILNVPIGTVKARIFRAREMLNKRIKELLNR